jgi:hypothetical protein
MSNGAQHNSHQNRTMLVARPLAEIPIPNITPQNRVFAHMARTSGYRIQ